jgi:hypothetical protein
MPSDPQSPFTRRRFPLSLAASPVVAALFPGSPDQEPSSAPAGLLEALGERPIASPEDAVNVFDFDTVARRTLPPAHYGRGAPG